jgi:hypothetical protein
MVFESIALGCAIVHGDKPFHRSGKLTNFYQADVLLKALSKVNPDFFPVPVNFLPYGIATGAMLFPIRDGEATITKEEIIRLYHKYGEYLHRGKINSFVERRADQTKPLAKEIGDVARKCRALLHPHKIHLHNSATLLVCSLEPVDVQFYTERAPT